MNKKKKRIKKRNTSYSDLYLEVPSPEGFQDNVVYMDYEITHDPLYIHQYPLEVNEQLPKLHEMISQNPKGALERLKTLIEKYPDVPVLYNFQFIATAYAGDEDKLDQLAEENYQRHPRYLFAKINYAELCMRKGLIRKVPRIFEHKFDLKLLYLERDRFHVNEVVGFFGTVGYYWLLTGDIDSAEMALGLLLQLDPESESTLRLKDEMFIHTMKRLVEMTVERKGVSQDPLSPSSITSSSRLRSLELTKIDRRHKNKSPGGGSPTPH